MKRIWKERKNYWWKGNVGVETAKVKDFLFVKYLVEGVQYRYRDPAMLRAAECGIDLELRN